MKKVFLKIGLFLAIISLPNIILAKTTKIVNNVEINGFKFDTSIYKQTDKYAEFPGGMEAMTQFLQKTLKYPNQAKKDKIEGICYISFTIEKDGTISNVKAIKELGGGCTQEAIRVVKAMPKWEPAVNKNKPVRQEFVLPISFSLKNASN